MSKKADLVKKTIKASDIKGRTVAVCGEGGDKTRAFVRDAGAQMSGGQPRSSHAVIFVHQLKPASELYQGIVALAKKKCTVLMNCKVSEDQKSIQGFAFDEEAYNDFRELTPKEKEVQRKQEALDNLEATLTFEERNHDGVQALLKVSDVPSRLVALESMLAVLRNPSPKPPSVVDDTMSPPEKRLRLDDSVQPIPRVMPGQRLEAAARFASSLGYLSNQATLAGIDDAIIHAADKRNALKPEVVAKETEIGRLQAAQKQNKDQLEVITKKGASLRAEYMKVAQNQGERKLTKEQVEAKLAEIDREKTANDQSAGTQQGEVTKLGKQIKNAQAELEGLRNQVNGYEEEGERLKEAAKDISGFPTSSPTARQRQRQGLGRTAKLMIELAEKNAQAALGEME